jgi:hypothetical protein
LIRLPTTDLSRQAPTARLLHICYGDSLKHHCQQWQITRIQQTARSPIPLVHTHMHRPVCPAAGCVGLPAAAQQLQPHTVAAAAAASAFVFVSCLFTLLGWQQQLCQLQARTNAVAAASPLHHTGVAAASGSRPSHRQHSHPSVHQQKRSSVCSRWPAAEQRTRCSRSVL